jgi:hypothetical protein
MDWLCWWCKHAAHVVAFSTALAFVTDISEKHKLLSPNAIQVKNWQKTTSIDEILDIKTSLRKVNQLLTCHNVRLTHNSIITIYDNADRMKEETKVFV